jgi:tetratricopeptide (TPR) repeat protein
VLKKISLFILLTSISYGQILREPVRLSAEVETWLNRDNEKCLQVLLQKSKSPGGNYLDLYNIGYLYYLQKDTTRAASYLQQCIDKNEQYVYANYLLAKMMQENNNLTGAREQLQTGLQHDSDNYHLRLEYAGVLQKQGQLDEAQEVLEDLLDDVKNKIEPQVALAGIYRLQKKYEKAKALLEGKLANNPESAVLIERAHIYQAMGDTEKAAASLLQICQEYPNSRELQMYRDTLSAVFNIKEVPPPSSLPKYTYRIQPDESLDYKVTYSFMTLGWVQVRMGPVETIQNKKAYPVYFYVNSNPSFEFIMSLHNIYESYIDVETMNAVQSRLYTPGSADYLVRTYYFDYDHGKFYAYLIFADGRYHYIEKHLPRRAQDSTSMLYFARGVVSNKSGGIITVVIDEEYKFGYITYLNETEELTVRDRDIEASKIFARADFEGVAGMNGDAWGWFSPGDTYAPLQGKFKIIVGSIYIAVDDEKQD